VSTFTDDQQKQHRKTFIDDCKQKAWGSACHAEWIAGQLEALTTDYTKLSQEDEKVAGEIKTLELSPDSHTKDNRDKRKALQERRNALAKQKEALGRMIQQGNDAAANLYGNVEASLALAKHAETWEWKELESSNPA
jgi:chromosome segregation ATPase